MKVKTDVRRYLQILALIVILFFLVQPQGLVALGGTYKAFYKGASVFVTVLVVIYFFIKNRCIPFHIVAILGFWGVMFFISAVRDTGSITTWCSLYLYTIALICLCYSYRKNIVFFMDAVFDYLALILTANMLLFFVLPNGFYNYFDKIYYFLGYKSSLQSFVIPCLFLAFVNLSYSRRLKISKFMIAVSIFSSVYEQNIMLVMTIIFILLVYYIRPINYLLLIKTKIVLIGYLAINVIVVGLNTARSDVYSFVVLGILDKGKTFNVRQWIWNQTIDLIKDNWLIGYGNVPDTYRMSLYNGQTHSHNQIIEFMYIGGIVLLILYIVFISCVLKNIQKANKYKIAVPCLALIVGTLIISVIEIFSHPTDGLIWVVMSMTFFLSDIDYQLEGSKI